MGSTPRVSVTVPGATLRAVGSTIGDWLDLAKDHRQQPAGHRSPVTMDVMFELFDNELLITDNAFHHVANRNYTN